MSAADIKEQFEIAKQGLRSIRDKNSAVRQSAEQGNQSIINEINEINDKISKIKELVARSNELDSAMKAKEKEIENLNKEKGDLNKEFDNLKQERDKLQAQLIESQESLNNVNAIVVTREEEVREKNSEIEGLQTEIAERDSRLTEINSDLQNLLDDITQVNRDIVDTDGEVQTLNQYNQEVIENIKNLLHKVNEDLNDILNMPQPPVSNMQQIHQNRVLARANPNDVGEGVGDFFNEMNASNEAARREAIHNERNARREINNGNIEEGILPNLFPESTISDEGNEEDFMSSKDQAVENASREPWWITLNPSEQANFRNVPEKRAFLRQEGNRRLIETQERRAEHRTPPNKLNMKYLTEWRNYLNDEENANWKNGDDTVKAELEALANNRMQNGTPPPANVGPFGGRRTRRRKSGLRMKSKTNKKGGYVAIYKKSYRRSSSNPKKTRSKQSSKSSKGQHSRKH